MQEKRNEQTTGTKTIKKIGKTTYEVIVHFNDKSSETMQDKLKRIMLREFRRKSDEKKMILIKKSLTSSIRSSHFLTKFFDNSLRSLNKIYIFPKLCIISFFTDLQFSAYISSSSNRYPKMHIQVRQEEWNTIQPQVRTSLKAHMQEEVLKPIV